MGFPVNIVDSIRTETDASGTITTGGTAQILVATNVNGQFVRIVNLAADILWVNTTGTAVANGTGSMPIIQNGSIEFPYKITNAISGVSATTGNKFTIKLY